MTRKQSNYRAILIKRCHSLKKNLWSDDEERRLFLQSRYGVNSFTKCSIEQLIAISKMVGFKYKNTNQDLTQELEIFKQRNNNITQKQLELIYKLWNTYSTNKDKLSLMKFCLRVIKKQYLWLGSMSQKEAQSLITALLKIKDSVYV